MGYNDFGQETCLLYGGSCENQGRCDLDGCEPDDNDVLNGWFDDDPEGLKKWIWKNKGCPQCKSKNVKKERLDYPFNDYLIVWKCNECNYSEEFD